MPVKRPRFKIDWASLILSRKFTVFLFVCFSFTLYLRAISKDKPPRGEGGGLIFGGVIYRGFFAYEFWGAYTWRGLFPEFYGMWSCGSNKHILRLMEGKLSLGLFSPSAISFNGNAIVWNFYPKKFHSSKLFKDWLPIWRWHMITFDYRTTFDL